MEIEDGSTGSESREIFSVNPKLLRTTATIDDFLLLCVLGKGSYAKVILVRKKDTQQIFALKVLKKLNVQKKNQQTKVQDERQILIEVNHPFIVKLYHTFQNERKLYFALEFCPGGELFSLLQKRRRFSEEQAKFYSAQILLAIEHLHSKGIVYRDLKPENVLLDKDGYIRITDFGLSKRGMNETPNTFSVCGTPEYLAPEVLTRKGHGKAVDWWTLGVLLFEMLVGVPPFYSRNREEMIVKIMIQEVTYPRGLSVNAQDLLTKLLIKDPALRLGSSPDGASQIRAHPWFDKLAWDALLAKEIRAPFVPILKRDTDVSNFDPEFTETTIDSIQDLSAMEECPENFDNWSFNGDNAGKSTSILLQENEL